MKNKFNFRILVLVLVGLMLISSFLLACGEKKQSSSQQKETSSQEKETNIVSEDPIVLRVSTTGAPELATTKGLYRASEYINEKSEGRIDVQVYHSGQLVSQKDTLQAIQEGGVEMALVDTSWMGNIHKPMSMFFAPYLFDGPDHMFAGLTSEPAQKLYREFEEKSGVNVVDIWYFGTRNTTSNIKAATPEEFSKIKLRVPGNQSYIEAAETIGANPTPIEFSELYMALKTGTVDGQENPLHQIYKNKFYEVQDYLILTGHITNNISPLISTEVLNSMPEDLQEILIEGFKAGGKQCTEEVIESEVSLLSELEKEGMEIIEVDKSIYKERAKKIYESHSDDWDQSIISAIKALD